jgi:hypothetical protein
VKPEHVGRSVAERLVGEIHAVLRAHVFRFRDVHLLNPRLTAGGEHRRISFLFLYWVVDIAAGASSHCTAFRSMH